MKTQEEKVSHTLSHTLDNGVLDCEEAEAKARLIASAPDLLDACKAIEPRLDRAGRGALACGPEGKDNDWETLKAKSSHRQSLAALKRRMVVGSQFVCTEHPRGHGMVGELRTVMKVQGNGVYWTVPSEPKRRWLDWVPAPDVQYSGDEFSITFRPSGADCQPFTCRYQIKASQP